MYSSVRARTRSLTLAAAGRRTESGERVRARLEGLNLRSPSNVVGEMPSSSTKVRPELVHR